MTTTPSLSLTESFAPSSSNTILTVTITRDDAAASSITPTVSSESALITDTPNTVSSDLTLVYVFTKSATDGSSSSSGSSSGSKSSGLPAGAIAGIVIGSVLLLIVLTLVVFCTSRRFARKRRREEASLHPSDRQRMSHAAASSSKSYHQARSQRSTIYSTPSSPPQELATQFNRLEVDGRGRPVEVLGSYKHPVELHGGSTTDLVAHVWHGPRRPAVPGKDEGGVIYLIPARRGDDVISDAGSAVCLSPPGTWETESWGASVSRQSHRGSGPGTRATPSKASSRDTLGYGTHIKE